MSVRSKVIAKLAAMPECTSCGECCGPVTATLDEAYAIRKHIEAKGIEWRENAADPLKCGFYAGKCTVYEVRPIACRMYGVVKEMACPFFPDAAVQSLPAKDAVERGLMSPNDHLLAHYFAPDRGARMEAAVADNMNKIRYVADPIRHHSLSDL